MSIFLLAIMLVTHSIDLDNLDDEEYWNTLDLDPYDIDNFDETDGIDDEPSAPVSSTNEVKATVRNPSDYEVDVFFRTDVASPIIYFFSLKPAAVQPINTFAGHKIFVAMGNTKNVIHTWTIQAGKSEYVISDTIDEFDGEEMEGLPSTSGQTDTAEEDNPASQISVTIRNNYDFAIDVFWKGDAGDQFIFSVEGRNTHNVNTFKGHTFVAKKLGSDMVLDEVVVSEKGESLSFGAPIMEDDDLLDFDYNEDDYLDEDDDDFSDLDDVEDDELNLDELGSSQTCSAGDDSCDASKPSHSKIEPLLSKWNKKQVNPYKGKDGFAAKFRNLKQEKIVISLDNSDFILQPGSSTTRYVTSGMIASWKSTSGVEYKTSKIHQDKSFYVLSGNNEKWNALHKKDMNFARKYYQENGQVWLVSADAQESKGFLWYASQVGHKHRISTKAGKYSCDDGSFENSCFETSNRLRLITMSLQPRIFEVKEFLSAQEVAYFLSLDKSVIPKDESSVVENIYRRTADLMRRPKLVADDLKLAHYQVGDSLEHQLAFDVQDCSSLQYGVLFIFLSEPTKGGDLEFDMATVTPTTSNAVLLQSKLPDGNVDPRAIFSINEVLQGDLWVLTLDMWDGSQVGCAQNDITAEFTP